MQILVVKDLKTISPALMYLIFQEKITVTFLWESIRITTLEALIVHFMIKFSLFSVFSMFLVYQKWPNFSSAQFSHSVMSNSLWPHELQHARLPCPSPTPRACSNSCPLSRWCHPTISSSVIPFSYCLQSFPASEPFPMSKFFASGGQSIRVSSSASVLPMNIQD